jgi:outer membrane protein assembly factor BamB
MADEAHRSQYGFVEGGARWMREALPNATFVGFTGTPLERDDKNTIHVFGPYSDVYDIRQAVEDGATKPLYYESRIVKLRVDEAAASEIEETLREAAEASAQGEDVEESVRVPLEALVGAQERVERLAAFIVEHWEKRRAAMEGKAMVVTMSRDIAARLYAEIRKLRPAWHDDDDERGAMKIVMTGSASDDAHHLLPHVRTKAQRKRLADRFKDPADDFRLVIVVDMWLTGFDVPAAHTMYLDKPLAGHNLMQAIARVNRVYGDKPGGLIVDLIGLADQLADALATYTQAGGTGEAIRQVQDEAVPAMQSAFEKLQAFFHECDYAPALGRNEHDVLPVYLLAIDHVLGENDGWKRFRTMVKELSAAFALAVPRPETEAVVEHLAFFQRVQAMIRKRLADDSGSNGRGRRDVDHAVRQIIGDAVDADDVVDLFAAAGLGEARLDVLSDEFLGRVAALEQKNLALETLRKLLNDQIRITERTNLVQSKKFREALEDALMRYTNKAITTAEMIARLIDLAQELKRAREEGKALGLSQEEIAFYDALAENGSAKEVMKSDDLSLLARRAHRDGPRHAEARLDGTGVGQGRPSAKRQAAAYPIRLSARSLRGRHAARVEAGGAGDGGRIGPCKSRNAFLFLRQREASPGHVKRQTMFYNYHLFLMLRAVVLWFAVSLVVSSAIAQSPSAQTPPASAGSDAPLHLVWQGGTVGPCAGCTGILAADLNGDGLDEIIFADNRQLFILEEEPQGIVITWSSPLYGFDDEVGYTVSILDIDAIHDDTADRTLIYVFLSGGRVDVYDGTARDLISSHYTGTAFPYTGAVGMVGDRQVMVISASDPYHVAVYDASTFEQLARLDDVFAEHIEIGDVTGDGRANVVLSDARYVRDGLVLDGESFETLWRHEETFGPRFRLVDTSGNDVKEILAWHAPGLFEAVSVQTREVLWSVDFELPFYRPLGAFDLWDVTGDGALDLVVPVGEPTGNQIVRLVDGAIIDGWPGQLRLDGVPVIALADLNGDGHPVVAHSMASTLRITSFSEDSMVWEGHFERGPFSIGLLSADAMRPGGVITASSTLVDAPGRLSVRDATSLSVTQQFEFESPDVGRHVAVATYDDRDDPIIVVAEGRELYALSYTTLDTLWSDRVFTPIRSLVVADVDGDAIPDVLVTTTSSNYAHIFSLDGTRVWERSLAWSISGVHVADCGLASSPDLFFYGSSGDGRLIHYDGKTRQLMGWITGLPLIRAIDSGDLLGDGRTVVALGHDDGRISLVDCESREVKTYDGLEPRAIHPAGVIHGLRLLNIDTSPQLEILVGSDRLHVFDGLTLEEVWQSDVLGDRVGHGNGLNAADLQGDGFTDIIVGSDRDVYHFVTSVQTHTEIGVGTQVPQGQTASQLEAFPNPFRDSVTLRVATVGAAPVSLVIYDILGRRIATVLYATLPAGVIDVAWDAGSLPSGIYFARLSVGGETHTASLIKR